MHDAKPEDESGFVTLIRHTPECLTGKATALFNWKAPIMQVSKRSILNIYVVHSMLVCACHSNKGGFTLVIDQYVGESMLFIININSGLQKLLVGVIISIPVVEY